MRLTTRWLLGTGVALLATPSSAQPPNHNVTPQAIDTTTQNPCAQLAAAAKGPVAPADMAMACLLSIPLDVDRALADIRGLKIQAQFQSDLPYLKAPPPDYYYPALDIIASLDAVARDVEAGLYTSEYAVQFELTQIIVSARDCHFNYLPDLTESFIWQRAGFLVSVSPDGVSLPDIYYHTDLDQLDSHLEESRVTHVNGLDVETWASEFVTVVLLSQFLFREAVLTSMLQNPYGHDPDANYNNLFVNVPNLAGDNGSLANVNKGAFQFAGVYQGSDTVLTFADGTMQHVDTFAWSGCHLSAVTDAASFVQLCASSSSQDKTSEDDDDAPTTMPNSYTPIPTTNTELARFQYYPQPFVMTSSKALAGYFPSNQPDAVVLACSSFTSDNEDVIEYENVFRSILATAASAGRTKLIIDLRGNVGGDAAALLDMFKQLFPSQEPYWATNMASFGLMNAIGKVSERQTAIDETEARQCEAPPIHQYDIRNDRTVQMTNFSSWEEFVGPVQRHGGNFTNIKRWDLNAEPFKAQVYGYGDDVEPQPQSFGPNAMVFLTDAMCSSACGSLVELLKTQVGVHAITVGGRRQVGPMQAVGGTKGGYMIETDDLVSAAEGPAKCASPGEAALFEQYDLVALSRLAKRGSGSVNIENFVRKGDESATPLQFMYEAADCRFFYTPDMLSDQSLVWKHTYDLRWNNGTCVQGSTGHPSSLSGADSSYFEQQPPARKPVAEVPAPRRTNKRATLSRNGIKLV
ncbi:hypothetical protein LTR56_026778 [Elasticomyces elasticus]|nr:hypothetical protein LTR56_026778 [Elasticomyces elasticus]KAK4900440.1 hypothetical protein LTR49_027466 [Elasticomyces elasticus]